MRKIMFILLLFVGVVMADKLSLSQDSGPYKWELVDTLSDTVRIVGTASDTLFQNIAVKYGNGYALAIVDSLVNDSVAIKTQTFYKSKGLIYGQVVADNVSSADANNPYVVVDLGVGTVAAGRYFSVVATGLTATVQKTILRAALYRYFK